MQKKINQFYKINKEIHEELNLAEGIYLSAKLTSRWKVDDLNGLNMVEFEFNNTFDKFVVVNGDNGPIIIRKKEHTIVVAIDCVKVAFIFDNKLEIK